MIYYDRQMINIYISQIRKVSKFINHFLIYEIKETNEQIIRQIDQVIMDAGLRKPRKYMRTLFDLQKFHGITFFINNQQKEINLAIKRSVQVFFEKYSARDEIQAIFTINKVLNCDEYLWKEKYNGDRILSWDQVGQFFIKKQVTFNICNLLNPLPDFIRGMEFSKFPYLQQLVLSNIQIPTMQWLSYLDAGNLSDLKLVGCPFYSIKGINKTLFPLLSGFTLVGCKFNNFNKLSRTKLKRDNREIRFVNKEGLYTNSAVQQDLQTFNQWKLFKGMRYDAQDLSFIFKIESSSVNSFVEAQKIIKQYHSAFSIIYTSHLIETQQIEKIRLQFFFYIHLALVQASLKSISKRIFPEVSSYFDEIDEKIKRLKQRYGIIDRKWK